MFLFFHFISKIYRKIRKWKMLILLNLKIQTKKIKKFNLKTWPTEQKFCVFFFNLKHFSKMSNSIFLDFPHVEV